MANDCSELQLKIARVMTKGTEDGVGNIMKNVNMELVWQFTCNIVKNDLLIQQTLWFIHRSSQLLILKEDEMLITKKIEMGTLRLVQTVQW